MLCCQNDWVFLFNFVFYILFVVFTPVIPPPFSASSNGAFISNAPKEKSGTSTELERFATYFSLNGAIELQRAAS